MSKAARAKPVRGGPPEVVRQGGQPQYGAICMREQHRLTFPLSRTEKRRYGDHDQIL